MMRKKFKFLLKIKFLYYYFKGKKFLNDSHFLEVQKLNNYETSKKPSRTEVLNYLLSLKPNDTSYLEIGVRNPAYNFHYIKATKKYSVDPGLEFPDNPVDFRMTSDIFFEKLDNGQILFKDIKFDVIFVDGLHSAEQVDRDIMNSLKYMKDDGFIVLHDCNPPTEWHARELHRYWHTPAQGYWNGTTWKAFYKWRCSPLIKSCCIDADWGIGILSKQHQIGDHTRFSNPFFEFSTMKQNRKESLNLIEYQAFKKMISRQNE